MLLMLLRVSASQRLIQTLALEILQKRSSRYQFLIRVALQVLECTQRATGTLVQSSD